MSKPKKSFQQLNWTRTCHRTDTSYVITHSVTHKVRVDSSGFFRFLWSRAGQDNKPLKWNKRMEKTGHGWSRTPQRSKCECSDWIVENESARHQYLCVFSTSAFSAPASTKTSVFDSRSNFCLLKLWSFFSKEKQNSNQRRSFCLCAFARDKLSSCRYGFIITLLVLHNRQQNIP